MSDHYKTLGVSPTATAKEIKDAHRSLVAKYYPRTEGAGNPELMKVINDAYNDLKTPERRAAYDRKRQSGNFNNSAGSSPGGSRAHSNGGSSQGHRHSQSAHRTAFDDIFEEIMRQTRASAANNPHFEEIFRKAGASAGAYAGFQPPPSMPFEAVLKKAAGDIDENDIYILNREVKRPHYTYTEKNQIISRATAWVKERPALASKLKYMAIAGIANNAGNDLFESIIAKAPKSFDREDMGEIERAVKAIHSDFNTRYNFSSVCAKLLKANPDIGRHMTGIAIAIIENNGDAGLFDSIVRHAPNSFDSEDLGAIERIINWPYSDFTVRNNFSSACAKLVKANPGIGRHMTGLAIKLVAKNTGAELFGAIIANAPKSFGQEDMAAIERIMKNLLTDYEVRHRFVDMGTKLVRANPDIARYMTGIAIAAVQENAGDGIFRAIIKQAPRAFDAEDMSKIDRSLKDHFNTDYTARENLERLKAELVQAQSSASSKSKPFWRFGF